MPVLHHVDLHPPISQNSPIIATKYLRLTLTEHCSFGSNDLGRIGEYRSRIVALELMHVYAFHNYSR